KPYAQIPARQGDQGEGARLRLFNGMVGNQFGRIWGGAPNAYVLAAATLWRWGFSNSNRDYLAFPQGADAAEGRLGSNQGNPLRDPVQPTAVINLPTHPDDQIHLWTIGIGFGMADPTA
ncbi:MAG: hypothetical protein EA402_00960, partial [Planctomycetota bacterium]